MLNISNPLSPQVVGSTPASASMVGASTVNIVGNDAFVVAKNENASPSSNDNGTGDSLTVVDISTPTSPTVVGSALRDTTNLFGAYGVAVSSIGGTQYAFVASQGLLQSQPTAPDTNPGQFSVIDLSTMTIVGHVSDPTSGPFSNALQHATAVSVQGTFAYVTAFYGKQLTVIDISNPDNPSIVGSDSMRPTCPTPMTSS